MVLSLQPAGLPCLYELLYSAAPVRAVMLLTQTGVCGDGRRGTVLPAGCRAAPGTAQQQRAQQWSTGREELQETSTDT